MNSERLSSISKIVGGNEQQKSEVSKDFEEDFLNEKWLDGEREKTAEENEILKSLIDELNIFLSEYGARPLDVRVSHIHILDKSQMSEEVFDYWEEKYKTSFGSFEPDKQAIIILGWYSTSNLELANMIAHELVHFISYNSVLIEENKIQDNTSPIKIHANRLGLNVAQERSDETVLYFTEINEAITEELVKRFSIRLKNIPLLSQEVEDMVHAREKHSMPDISSVKIEMNKTPGNTTRNLRYRKYSYGQFRKDLNKLIKEIYKKRQNDFASEEEIFKIFATASMTGNVKELATLIDSTLGSGTFKKIAQPERVGKINE